MLIAARTAPRQSYINLVKRVISLSNIAEIETDVVHKKLPACSRGVKASQKCVLLLTFSDITLNSEFPFLTKWKSTKLFWQTMPSSFSICCSRKAMWISGLRQSLTIQVNKTEKMRKFGICGHYSIIYICYISVILELVLAFSLVWKLHFMIQSLLTIVNITHENTHNYKEMDAFIN